MPLDWTGAGTPPAPTGGGGGGAAYTPLPLPKAPAAGGNISGNPYSNTGKASIDITDPIGSLANIAGGMFDLARGTLGGAAGIVGSIGIGDQNLGQVANVGVDLTRKALGTIGDIGPSKDFNVGTIVQGAASLISIPSRLVEEQVAKARLSSGAQDIPLDLQYALDAGQPVDQVAAELVKRNAGYSSNPIVNLAGQLVLDPINLIGPGIGKMATFAGEKALLKAGEEAGVAARAMDALAHGVPVGGQAVVQQMAVPASKGLLDALVQRVYTGAHDTIGRASTDGAAKWEEAAGLAATQNAYQIAADELKRDSLSKLAAATSEGQLRTMVEQRLEAFSTERVRRGVQELVNRVKPTFAGDAEMAAKTYQSISLITDLPVEVVAKLFPTVTRELAQQAHMFRWTASAHELEAAKSAVTGAAAAAARLDPTKLTVLSADTITQDVAKRLVASKDPMEIVRAVSDIGDLRVIFGGRHMSADVLASSVREYLQKHMSAFPQEIHAATTGAHALPPSLAEWAAKWGAKGPGGEPGMRIGFMPDNLVSWADNLPPALADTPQHIFMPFHDASVPLSIRNPLTRVAESLNRGITQQTIKESAQRRFIDTGVAHGLSEAQSRTIFGRLMDAAQAQRITPRGLFGEEVEKVFRESGVLTPEQLATLGRDNMVYMLLDGFRGHLSEVGVTQWISGTAKRAFGGKSNLLGVIAERIYPMVKFKLSPTFQAQELIESPFWNFGRGIRPVWKIKPDSPMAHMQDIMHELLLDPKSADKAFGDTAEYSLIYLAGQQEVASNLLADNLWGRVTRHLPDVAGTKEANRIAQVGSGVGELWLQKLGEINPALRQMHIEAFGRDGQAAAEAFYAERKALTGTVHEAQVVLDKARAEAVAAAARGADQMPWDLTAGEAARAVTTAQGRLADASVAAGGTAAQQLAANETVWQAFREAMLASTKQANKTHFFNSERGFLERSLNHPYLGLYPLSYMVGKVLPEFARFLFKRPFGYNAPLVGYAAAVKVQQAILASRVADPNWDKFLKDNEGAIYFAQLLLPGTPTDIPFNAPAYMRHEAQANLQGKPFSTARITSGISDTMTNAVGLARTVTNVAQAGADIGSILQGAGQDLQHQLDQAAREYDGMFGN